MKKILKEFSEFLKQYNVIGLAVAIIIGGKLNQLVSSLVNDLLMPIIFQPALKAAHITNFEELNLKGIYYGKVLGSFIDFLIVAFLVFLLVRSLNKLKETASTAAKKVKKEEQ